MVADCPASSWHRWAEGLGWLPPVALPAHGAGGLSTRGAAGCPASAAVHTRLFIVGQSPWVFQAPRPAQLEPASSLPHLPHLRSLSTTWRSK